MFVFLFAVAGEHPTNAGAMWRGNSFLFLSYLFDVFVFISNNLLL